MSTLNAIQDLLTRIYGGTSGRLAFEKVTALLERFSGDERKPYRELTEKDAILITYADALQGGNGSPLQCLGAFAGRWLTDSFSAIHLLPFYPYSSDDGFSVIDYLSVDPAAGTWRDVADLGGRFDLMFDYVLNHISAQSDWFKQYLLQTNGFEELAIEVSAGTDLSAVTRPRALPLLTEFNRCDGKKVHLWTTFSADQIDLNYKSIDVLIRMIDVLLTYARKGARFVRLDAVAYLWKEIGTTCIHHPKTHFVVQLLRRILDYAAPDVVIITETNVPHEENISYFGNGRDEAQMVYNFTLPPLLLHTLLCGDARDLTQWARGLSTPSVNTTFFNFTASHDGIGVRPLEGILSRQGLDALVEAAERKGGRVSRKHNPDGSESPYELNITYVDALGAGDDAGSQLHAARFLASQAIALALPGVPGVYLQSLLGCRNWLQGVAMTGRARSINREKPELNGILEDLKNLDSFRSLVFYPLIKMLKIRRRQPAFHPQAASTMLDLNRSVFSIRRDGRGQLLYALTNVSAHSAVVSLPDAGKKAGGVDLISGEKIKPASVALEPYQVRWIVVD